MSKHTPGPWKVWNQMVIMPDEEAKNHFWFTVAEVVYQEDRDEKIANLNLIATAPELLEVSKLALARLLQYDYSAMQPTIEKLKATIAKAEGTGA